MASEDEGKAVSVYDDPTTQLDDVESRKNLHKKLFYEEVDREIKKKGHTTSVSDNKYMRIVEALKAHQNGSLSSLHKQDGYSQAYQWTYRYELLVERGKERLIFKREPGETYSVCKQVSCYSTFFDDIHAVHLPLHDKGEALQKSVKRKFGSTLPEWTTKAYTKFCPECNGRPKSSKVRQQQPAVTDEETPTPTATKKARTSDDSCDDLDVSAGENSSELSTALKYRDAVIEKARLLRSNLERAKESLEVAKQQVRHLTIEVQNSQKEVQDAKKYYNKVVNDSMVSS